MVIIVIVAIVGMGIFGGWCVCFISSRGRAAYIGMPSKSPLHGDRYLPFLFAVLFPCRCRVVSVSFSCRCRTYIEIDNVRSCGRR